jgi:uncharacterized OB-fold protein
MGGSEVRATSAPAKPLPVASPESAPFWRAAKEHRLLLPHCNKCGGLWFPPSLRCMRCLSDDTGWIEASGKAKIHSFVTFHRLYHPAFAGELPYVVAVAELAEGPRLLTNIIGISVDEVRCGMPVSVVFDDVSAEIAIPKFAPSGAPARA